MKRSLIAALAVLTLGSSAFATSIRDVRLMYREIPVGHAKLNPSLNSVIVYGDGEAVRVTCDAFSPRACDRKTIRRYNAYQIDSIGHLIEAARRGRIVRSKTSARCIVAPSSEARYSADNDQVLLEKGNICTAIFENTSPAAKRLVTLLETLRGIRR